MAAQSVFQMSLRQRLSLADVRKQAVLPRMLREAAQFEPRAVDMPRAQKRPVFLGGEENLLYASCGYTTPQRRRSSSMISMMRMVSLCGISGHSMRPSCSAFMQARTSYS